MFYPIRFQPLEQKDCSTKCFIIFRFIINNINIIFHMDIVKKFNDQGLLFINQNQKIINGSPYWGVFRRKMRFSADQLNSAELEQLFVAMKLKENKLDSAFIVTEGWDTEIDVNLVDLMPKEKYTEDDARSISLARSESTFFDIETSKEIMIKDLNIICYQSIL